MAEEKKKIAFGNIGNALKSVATDHITTVAGDVFDEERQKYQNEVNTDLETTDNEIKADLEAETARAKAAEEANATSIIDTERIADGAVTSDKLADGALIEQLKKTATFVDIATPTTNPGTPDGPVFYIATEVGIYSNFNGIEVTEGEAVIFKWDNGTWTKNVTGFATQEKLSELGSKANSLSLNYNLVKGEFVKVGKWFDYNGNKIESQDFVYVDKLDVKPNTLYRYTGCLFNIASILEYNKSNEIVASHYSKVDVSEPWYEMEFTTKRDCSYVKLCSVVCGNSINAKNIGMGLYCNDKNDKALEKVQRNISLTNSYRLGNILDQYSANEGYYYNSVGEMVTSADFIAYDKVNVKGGYEYLFLGCMFGKSYIVEYDALDNIIETHGDSSVSYENPIYSLKFRTKDNCSYLKFGSVVSFSQVNKLQAETILYQISEESIISLECQLENLLKKSNVIKGKWVTETGEEKKSQDFDLYDNVPVKPNVTYRYIGCLFAKASIVEYDSGNNLVAAPYNNTPYTEPWYEMEFTTNVRTSYLRVSAVNQVSSVNVRGIGASLVYLKTEDAYYIPERTYFVNGIEKSMYYDRFGLSDNYKVVLNPNPRRLYSYPKQRRWSYKPSNTTPFNVGVNVWNNQELKFSKNTYCEVLERNNPTSAKNILWVGDSISDYHNTAKYCKELFKKMSGGIAPTFVGTRHLDGTPDESYAGHDMYFFVRNKTYDNLISPFWDTVNNTLDFGGYNAKVGIDKIHSCVIATGFNDAGGIIDGKYTLAELYSAYKDFVEAITLANDGIKIVLCLCPLESSWIRNRDTQQHTYWVNRIRMMEADLAKKYNNIILSDAFYCIDSENGYPTVQESIASVYSDLAITETETTDSTHPTELGCKEWGYAAFPALLKSVAP